MKTIKSLLVAALACLMLITAIPCTAFAEETLPTDTYGTVSVVDMSDFELLDDSVMTREEAIQMLGLTPEEAEKVTLYTYEIDSDSLEATTRSVPEQNSQEVKTYEFSFSRYNRGLDRIYNGNKMKWGARLVSTNGTGVLVVRCSYDEPNGYEEMYLTPGYYDTQQTTWFSIYYGGTYYWRYHGDGGTYDNPATHTIRIVVAII